MHIIDASRTEVISHNNKHNGDHVTIKKTHRKKDGPPGSEFLMDAGMSFMKGKKGKKLLGKLGSFF